MLKVTGDRQFRALARDLRAAGSPGRRGIRSKLRTRVTAAVRPMQKDVQQAIAEIPAHGPDHTGLRSAMAAATKIQLRSTSRVTLVRLWVNPRLMPQGQQSLPALMEGDAPWRHPVYGRPGTWVPEDAHPYFDRTVKPKLPGVRAAAVSAAAEVAAEVERGI